MNKFKVIIGLIIIAGIILFGVAQFCGGVYKGYSEGERTGIVTKISKKGFFWKSWEGDLLVGGMDKSDNGTLIPTTWRFSLPNTKDGDALAAEIATRSAKGDKISLHYNQWWIKPILLSTDNQVSGITVAK